MADDDIVMDSFFRIQDKRNGKLYRCGIEITNDASPAKVRATFEGFANTYLRSLKAIHAGDSLEHEFMEVSE